MSTAIAYPPSHSSVRPPSNSDAHTNHSSASPRNYKNITPTRPSSDSSHNQNAMSSSPRPSSTLAPRPSAEGSRPGSQNTPLVSHSQAVRISPQASKVPAQQPRSDDATETLSHVVVPSVEVKTERPSTPEAAQPATAPASRHRPSKLDLSTSVTVPPGRPSGTLTAKDSAPLTAIRDIGIACLSPGFQTEHPRMTQQLQRSMDLREQQRQIIESRLHKNNKDGESSGSKGNSDHGGSHAPIFPKPPGTSKRKGPPPGLSITAPSAHQFASEPRVIQSAPLGQSFTGLHKGQSNVHPLSRQVLESSHQHRRPSNQHAPPSATSSSQQFAPHMSTPQSANRLPPIQDVFANDNLGQSSNRPTHTLSRANSGPGTSSNGQMYAPLTASATSTAAKSPNSAQYNGALPSPGFPPAPQSAGLHPPSHAKERDYKSAEEAVHAMAGGREELLPKIVHYGGHQPPTPPSPLPPSQQARSGERKYSGPGSLRAEMQPDVSRSMSGRRRTRDEYERDGDDRRGADDHNRMDIDDDRGRSFRAVKNNGEAAAEAGAASGAGLGFGAWTADEGKKRSPETMRRKKEEFMALCARAWDLLHE